MQATAKVALDLPIQAGLQFPSLRPHPAPCFPRAPHPHRHPQAAGEKGTSPIPAICHPHNSPPRQKGSSAHGSGLDPSQDSPRQAPAAQSLITGLAKPAVNSRPV